MDPELLATSPESVTRGAALNALAMTVEGLLSPQCSPFAAAPLCEALGVLVDPADRLGLALASLLVGQGANASSVGLAAAASHAVCGWAKAPNGVVDAVLLPHVLDRHDPADPRLVDVAARLGQATTAADGVRALAGDVPRRLRDLGVPRECLDRAADLTLEDYASGTHPVAVDRTLALEVLEAAW